MTEQPYAAICKRDHVQGVIQEIEREVVVGVSGAVTVLIVV